MSPVPPDIIIIMSNPLLSVELSLSLIRSSGRSVFICSLCEFEPELPRRLNRRKSSIAKEIVKKRLRSFIFADFCCLETLVCKLVLLLREKVVIDLMMEENLREVLSRERPSSGGSYCDQLWLDRGRSGATLFYALITAEILELDKAFYTVESVLRLYR